MIQIFKVYDMPTHAGSVTFRRSHNKLLFLIISSANGTSWVLPKGHIELGESPEEAALRELHEEAGVTGQIIDRLSIKEFSLKKEKVSVQYFLVKELCLSQPRESRIIRWEDEHSALRLLPFKESKSVFREGVKRIKELTLNNNC
ncbi:MAG: NUDIX domain-containing protein [Candidatus Brocadiaceae bacterium]|nr:NUDIX domain-containing protein [Candidatus Brocadiaceae bacterium]